MTGTYNLLKDFFVKYGKAVTDLKKSKKTFGVIISKNTANEQLNEFIHTNLGFVAKNKVVLLTLINDFIKVNNVVLVDGVKYKILASDEHKYLQKPLYLRCVVSKMEYLDVEENI